MGLIADIILCAAALGAMLYCAVLSRRLNRFNDLERGVGGAIATLSTQVDDMTRTVRTAHGAAAESAASLGDLTSRAERAARHLELLVASLHDLPAPDGPTEDSRKPPEDAQAPVEEEQCEDPKEPVFLSRRRPEAVEE